nr:unnamed protein product [Callosobruchus analis]
MIQLCLPHILPHIKHIINFCLEKSVYPSSWKKSLIIPLPKKTQVSEYKDLRAISILPVLCKFIEKAVDIQLREYIEGKQILPDVQSGFRRGHSCTTALLKITDDIVSASDIGEYTIVVLLDFSRAFDTINYSLLLKILKYIGLSVSAVEFFGRYLSNRVQRVILNGDSSEFLSLTSGVPQGSVLGPLLFTIYTSQLIKSLQHTKLQLYADDTQIYGSFKPENIKAACDVVNADVGRYVDLSADHCLVNNAEKTKVLLFGPRRNRSSMKSKVKIQIHGRDIPIVEQAASLGITLDSDLRFDQHVTKLLQKSYATLRTVYANRHFLTKQLKIVLCESLVLSLLNYADVVYSSYLTAALKQKIQKVENSCLRLIHGIRRRNSISYTLKPTGWLNMQNRRLLHSACLYHRIITEQNPVYLHRKIKFRTDVHTLNIRYKGMVSPPKHYHEFFKRSFSYQIYSVYNGVPIDLKQSSNIKFKLRYRQRLMDSQV